MGLKKFDIFNSVNYIGLFEEYALDIKIPSTSHLKKKGKREKKIRNISG